MSARSTIPLSPGALGRTLLAVVALGLAAGCQPIVRPAAPAPEPPATRLLDAARLELPDGCAVSAGRTYRMSYSVGLDGRTGSLGAITPPDAPACLQAALAAWVATFRYAAPAEVEEIVTDWMLVTAARGS